MNIDVFKCTDSIEAMEQSLRDDGLIGISGGRISVRRALDELLSQINELENNEEERFGGLTYNHPNTELAYIWDSEKFSLKQAKRIVKEAYDRARA